MRGGVEYPALSPCTVRLDAPGRDATLLRCGNSYVGSRARLSLDATVTGATVLVGSKAATTVTVTLLDAGAATALATASAPVPTGADASAMRRARVAFDAPVRLSGDFTLEVTVPKADGGRVGTFGAKALLNPALAPSEESFAVSTFPGSWIAAGVPLLPYAELATDGAVGEATALSGRALVAVGDSLTDYTTYPDQTLGQNWLQLMAKRTGCVPFNCGYGGTGYAAKPSAGSAYLPFPARVSDAYLPASADVVLVEGSVNDLLGYGGIPTVGLGSPSDAASDADGASWCARVRKALSSLRARYPSATLLVASMPPTATDNPATPGSGTREMVAAQRAICADLGVPFLDLYEGMALPTDDAERLSLFCKKADGSQDTVHLNAKGHRLMTNALQAFVLANVG